MDAHVKHPAADAIGFGLAGDEGSDQPGPRLPDGMLVEGLAQTEFGEQAAQGVGETGGVSCGRETPPPKRCGAFSLWREKNRISRSLSGESDVRSWAEMVVAS